MCYNIKYIFITLKICKCVKCVYICNINKIHNVEHQYYKNVKIRYKTYTNQIKTRYEKRKEENVCSPNWASKKYQQENSPLSFRQIGRKPLKQDKMFAPPIWGAKNTNQIKPSFMKELIRIVSAGEGRKAVDARELHQFLESKQDFSTWIRKRIERYGFVENTDYQSFHKFVERGIGGSTRIEYALSINMAKELSMVENNERGKEARRYFIACEKELYSKQVDFSDPQLVLQLAQNWAREHELRLEAEAKLEEQRPLIMFPEGVRSSKASCLVGELAKILAKNDYPIDQSNLFRWMRDNGYLGKSGERYNIPTYNYIKLGLFELNKEIRTESNGVLNITLTPKVTVKGQVYFVNKFLKQLHNENAY